MNYQTILSANLHTRFEEEYIRSRPTSRLYTSIDAQDENAHEQSSPSFDPNTPNGSASASPVTPNGTSSSHGTTSNGDSRPSDAKGDGSADHGAGKEEDSVEGRATRMVGSQQHSHVKTHWWITAWFVLTIPVIFWDAGYCFMRPRSMVGGDLHWIWSPYALYQDIDYVYGLPSLQRGDGFTNAQSFLNIVENLMNIYYVYLAHFAQSPYAPLLGFASAIMTLSKTALYWLQEYYCGGCAVGHNDMKTLLLLWVLPNGLWLVVPTFVVYQLAKDISASIRVASNVEASKKE